MRSLRLLFILLLALPALVSCEGPAPAPLITNQKTPGEPVIRVRLTRAAAAITFTGPSRIELSPFDAPDRKQLLPTPVTIHREAGVWVAPWTGGPPRADAILEIRPLGPSPLRISGDAYPGFLRLVPVPSTNTPATAEDSPTADAPAVLAAAPRTAAPVVAGAFDVINHVRLESYLPGVLQGELYVNWEPAAYLAQAIAARSYAIDRMVTKGTGNYYDVEAGQASQAYTGVATNPLALRAVSDSAGLVLTWRGRVLPAYYSSTCGGATLSPRDVFNSAVVPAPLQAHTDPWCAGTRWANWGPYTEDAAVFSRRVAAWGHDNKMTIGTMSLVRTAAVSKTNEVGRPTEFQLTDERGKTFPIRAEMFRNACNFSSPADKVPPPRQKLRSSFFKIRVEGDTVIFSDGHGYGHGVGLCQYGAQAMARAGKGPLEILHQYYPGAKIERAY